jgi:hypothetical protein
MSKAQSFKHTTHVGNNFSHQVVANICWRILAVIWPQKMEICWLLLLLLAIFDRQQKVIFS